MHRDSLGIHIEAQKNLSSLCDNEQKDQGAKSGFVIYDCSPNTQEVDTGGSWVCK